MAIQTAVPRTNAFQPKIQWTQDAANKAAEKAKFIRVNLQGNKPTPRFFSGYKRSWYNSVKPEELNTIFVPEYRISGTPEAVRAALVNALGNQAVVEQALANAITRDNWQLPHNVQFIEQELARIEQVKAKEAPSVPIDWNLIKTCADNLDKATPLTKGGNVAKGVHLAPGRASAGRSLKDKVLSRGEGQAYDVSGIDLNTGHGGRSVRAPKNMTKAGKTGRITVAGLRIQSNDPERYRKAIELTYGPQGLQTYAPQIQEFDRQYREHQASQQYQASVMPAPALLGARAPSPRTLVNPVAQPRLVAPVAGAALAPSVSIRPAVPTAATIRSPTNRLGVVGGAGLPGIPTLRQ